MNFYPSQKTCEGNVSVSSAKIAVGVLIPRNWVINYDFAFGIPYYLSETFKDLIIVFLQNFQTNL